MTPTTTSVRSTYLFIIIIIICCLCEVFNSYRNRNVYDDNYNVINYIGNGYTNYNDISDKKDDSVNSYTLKNQESYNGNNVNGGYGGYMKRGGSFGFKNHHKKQHQKIINNKKIEKHGKRKNRVRTKHDEWKERNYDLPSNHGSSFKTRMETIAKPHHHRHSHVIIEGSRKVGNESRHHRSIMDESAQSALSEVTHSNLFVESNSFSSNSSKNTKVFTTSSSNHLKITNFETPHFETTQFRLLNPQQPSYSNSTVLPLTSLKHKRGTDLNTTIKLLCLLPKKCHHAARLEALETIKPSIQLAVKKVNSDDSLLVKVRGGGS